MDTPDNGVNAGSASMVIDCENQRGVDFQRSKIIRRDN